MHNVHSLGAPLVAALLVSAPVSAQVTPEQVWQNWKELSAGYGQTLTTGAETREGDTLTVTDVVLASEADGVTTRAEVERIVFRDRGDGTVEITMSPQIPMTAVSDAPGEEAFTLNVTLDQPGLVILASASEAETRYDFTAPAVTMTLDAPATEADRSATAAELALEALAGNYAVTSSDLSRITSDVTADRLRLKLDATDPDAEAGGTVSLTTTLSGIAGQSAGAMLPAEQMEDMAAALAAGFATEGSMSYQGADYSLDLNETSGTTQSSGKFGPGSVTFAMDKDRMAYAGTAAAAEITVSGSNIPVPEIGVSYTEGAFDFLMPVSRSDTPQDFRLLTRIVDLALSDEVWGMFDPSAALPRDPATLVIDLDGQARWLIDLFAPEAAEMETVPGELNALTVNDVTLRAAGASLAGKGAFTFDNTDLTTFDGMPAPTGVLDLTMVGATALLDRLSQSGLLPPDQVMGAKMMIGLFAKPGEGEDTLTTQIEFRDKGLYVNGQQLQ
jgi:hypothetical protein